jgi:hypothetical protein
MALLHNSGSAIYRVLMLQSTNAPRFGSPTRRCSRPLRARDRAFLKGSPSALAAAERQIVGGLDTRQTTSASSSIARIMLWCELLVPKVAIAMPYRTYAEVTRLDSAIQHQLLQRGDAVERVWAAWALGTALGVQSVPDLLSSLHDSPVPGTRRHLLVVLAGLGERAVLCVFAQDDPDDYVRATACQYLLRISDQTDHATQQFVRERLFHDASAIVRQAIVGEISVFSALQSSDLAQLAHDSDAEVRQAAIERLLVTESPDWLFSGVLGERIRQEAQADLRHHVLQRSLESGGAAHLLAISLALDVDRALEILNLLVETKHQFDWKQLAPLSLAHEPLWDVCLIQLLRPTESTRAVAWLIMQMARATTWPQPQNRAEAKRAEAVRLCAWHARQCLMSGLPDLQAHASIACDREALRIVIAQLQKEICELDGEDEDDEWDMGAEWYAQAIHERQLLITTLTHWLESS